MHSCRRLHGRRGLKSLQARSGQSGRRLHGRRGLKSNISPLKRKLGLRRRLHGRRGLKSVVKAALLRYSVSPPSRAAWIEISHSLNTDIASSSPPSRAAWIEIPFSLLMQGSCDGRRLHGRRGLKSSIVASSEMRAQSPPSRAAWIEIQLSI